MKKSNLYICTLWAFIAIFSPTSYGQQDSLHQTVFPEYWDAERLLRGENSRILIWKQEFNQLLDREVRTCLLIEVKKDSTGRLSYLVSEKVASPPYTKWYIPTVHRHPSRDRLVNANPEHYRISKTKEFDHVPTKADIAYVQRIGIGYFNQNRNSWQCKQAGINMQLWKQMYNAIPSEEDFKKFIFGK